jgi:hypothetical protein
VDDDYFLADDEALMRLMQKLQYLGDPGLQQRLRDAGDAALDSITKTQFIDFLRRVIGMMPQDILSVQRIVGFIENTEKLKVTDIMVKIMERAGKRQKTEVDTLNSLA